MGVGMCHYYGSSGAGHGGRGGKGSNQPSTGAFYGSVTKPQMYGSSGGCGSTPGGGLLYVKSTKVTVDGDIMADGASASRGSRLGGGSGGSIMIETSEFVGTGTIQVNGGDGGYDGAYGGGGGSGGRIAVYHQHLFFKGAITAFGGNSRVEAGAAGTIYYHNDLSGFSTLEVYNKGRRPSTSDILDYRSLSTDSARTWITAISASSNPKLVFLEDFTFDVPAYEGFGISELRLGGGVHLAFEPELSRSNLRVHTISKLVGNYEGGSFGFLHTGPRQIILIKDTDYYIPINLKIYQNGYLKTPPKIMLHKNSLSLNGFLLGVKDLTISKCLVNFGRFSSAVIQGSIKPLSFKFDSVALLDGANLRLNDTSNEYLLSIGRLEIIPGGVIQGKNLSIKSKDVSIKKDGLITVDGQGEKCRPFNRYSYGSGGSHAGYGGFGAAQSSRQEPFDSLYVPTKFGGAGHAHWYSHVCHGGYGGGRLNMTVKRTLQLDGTISSRYLIMKLYFKVAVTLNDIKSFI